MTSSISIDGYPITVQVKTPEDNLYMVSCEVFFYIGAIGSTLEEALATLLKLFIKLREVYLKKLLGEFDIKLTEGL